MFIAKTKSYKAHPNFAKRIFVSYTIVKFDLRKIDDYVEWCSKNCEYDWIFNYFHFGFNSADEAFQFRLISS